MGRHSAAGESRSSKRKCDSKCRAKRKGRGQQGGLKEDRTQLRKMWIKVKYQAQRVNVLSYFISLTLSFSICKTGVITKPIS